MPVTINGTSTAVIPDASGSIGVGTASPNVGGWGRAITLNGAASTNGAVEMTENGTLRGYMSYTIGGGLNVYAAAGQSLNFGANNAQAVRVDTSGNVGIGTTSPSTYATGMTIYNSGSQQLSLVSTSSSQYTGPGLLLSAPGASTNYGGTYLQHSFNVGSSDTTDLAFSMQQRTATGGFVGTFYTYNYKAQIHQFFTASGGGTERVRINSGGAFLVGTVNTGSMAGGYSTQFIVVGDDRYTHNRMIIGCGSSTSSYDATIYPNDSGIIFNNNSNSRDYIFVKQSGAVYATVTAIINNVSDHRLKENIVDMNGALDKLARVRPVHYNFKGDVETKMPWGESTVDGFIAHELQAVMPEAVYGEKDAVYEDGKIKPQQVDMTRLIPVLVGAVQELSAKVDALQAEINALKGAA